MNINYLFESMMKYISSSIIITDANGYIEVFNSCHRENLELLL